MHPTLLLAVVLVAALLPAHADSLVVKDAKTQDVVAVVDPDSPVPLVIGGREVIITRPELNTTEPVARTIRIPIVDFDNATLGECADYIRQRSRELDSEPDPNKKGLNVRILSREIAQRTVDELKLRNASIHHVLTSMAEATDTAVEFGNESILIKPPGKASAAPGPSAKPSAMEMKAMEIIIPVIDFDATTLLEARDYLRSRSRELDNAQLDPAKKGIRFRIADKKLAETEIHELKLRNVTLHHAASVIAEATGSTVEFREEEILFKRADTGVAVHPGQSGHPTATATKARWIDIPTIDFNGTWLSEAVDFLRLRSRELDVTEFDRAKKGVNIRIVGTDLARKEIKSLKLRDVSLHAALTAIADATGTTVEFGDGSIVFKPAAK